MTLPASLTRLSRYLPFEPFSLIRLLVLLFPIGIINVRHWGSTIFGLLIITSLILLPSRRNNAPPLQREEKILLGILVGYFLVALASITANGWDEAGQYAIGTELRFLLIIPFYLVVRQIEGLWRFLWTGSLLCIVVSTYFGLHEFFVLQKERVFGVYGPLFFGPVLLITIALQLPWFREIRKYSKRNIVVVFLALVGLFVVFVTGARSAYVALVVSVFLALFYYFRVRYSVSVFLLSFGLLVFSYNNIDIVNKRVSSAFSDTAAHISFFIENPDVANKYGKSSPGQRLEMWRGAVYLFMENPVFGIGRYNFNKEVRVYGENLQIHIAATRHSHPHNVFFEALAAKGIFGLVAVLALYLYPLIFFIRTRHQSRESAFAGILLMTSIWIFSQTAVAPVYYGNFVAVFLIFLSVIFAWHSRQIRASDHDKPAPAG